MIKRIVVIGIIIVTVNNLGHRAIEWPNLKVQEVNGQCIGVREDNYNRKGRHNSFEVDKELCFSGDSNVVFFDRAYRNFKDTNPKRKEENGIKGEEVITSIEPYFFSTNHGNRYRRPRFLTLDCLGKHVKLNRFGNPSGCFYP